MEYRSLVDALHDRISRLTRFCGEISPACISYAELAIRNEESLCNQDAVGFIQDADWHSPCALEFAPQTGRSAPSARFCPRRTEPAHAAWPILGRDFHGRRPTASR